MEDYQIELVNEMIADGKDFFEILEAIKVRKPLGEDVTTEEYDEISTMVDMTHIKGDVMTTEELRAYFYELNGLDWFYEYSDDHSVWKRGSEAYSKARQQVYRNETTYKMWNDFVKWTRGKGERPKGDDYEV